MKSCHSNQKISTTPALLCLPNPSSGLCCQSILDEARLTVSVRASKSDNSSYCSDNKEETQLRLVFKGQVFTSSSHLFMCKCTCVHILTQESIHMQRSENNLWESVHTFYHVGSMA